MTRLEELNRFWAEVSRAVAQGDFVAYQATYHVDAVLVAGSSAAAYPIARAFARWQQGFMDTLDGRIQASVDFRFSQRLGDETSAHETGIFRYATVEGKGSAQKLYMHFEALLVKKDGWLMLMEHQRAPATEAEWDALY